METMVDKSILFRSLDEKVRKAQEAIEQAAGVGRVGIAFTGGKDSTTLLHLVRRLYGGTIPFPVINIDTSVKFKEIYAFRDRLREEWRLDLHVFRNEEAIERLQIAADRAECCMELKAKPLGQAIVSMGLDGLMTGVRWDENPARAAESYFVKKENPAHTRIQPLLHFSEKDIWKYIRKYDVPYCELYEKGYRSLGCEPCTKPAASMDGSERQGRSPEKEVIMGRLRDLGYF
jgi:phosphoadenosine phosphosulfate reductase